MRAVPKEGKEDEMFVWPGAGAALSLMSSLMADGLIHSLCHWQPLSSTGSWLPDRGTTLRKKSSRKDRSGDSLGYLRAARPVDSSGKGPLSGPRRPARLG